MKKIVIFHSYLSSPCLDGLISTMMLGAFSWNIDAIIPHRRTEDMKSIIKSVIDSMNDEISVVYLDIGPVDDEELKIVSENAVEVLIWDHHELNIDMNKISSQNIQFKMDYDSCITEQVFEETENIPRKYKPLVDFMQFTEYEGTNPKLQKSYRVEIYCEHLKEMLPDVNIDTLPYFVIDEILSTSYLWKKLFTYTIFDSKESKEKFKIDSLNYLNDLLNICLGYKDPLKFQERLILLNELKNSERNSKIVSLNVNKDFHKVLFHVISIQKFGRSLEPIIRTWMNNMECSYAVLVNPEKNGEVYLSLRRINEKYNAKDIAKVIGDLSGTTKYGGHPWGAGATMSTNQFNNLKNILNL